MNRDPAVCGVVQLPCALLLFACGTVTPPASRPASRPALRRLAAPRPEPDFVVGDQVRFELRIQDPGEPDRVLELGFMYLSAPGSVGIGTLTEDGVAHRYEYPTGLILLDLRDPAQPKRRQSQTVMVPLPPLRVGFTRACAVSQGLGPKSRLPPGHPAREPVISAMFAFVAFFQALTGFKQLESIMMELADVPILLLPTLLFGASVDIAPQFARATLVGSPLPAPWDGPCWELPWQITLMGSTVVEGHLLLVESRPPLSVVAGLVGLEAWQPGTPGRRLSAHLVELSAPGAPVIPLPGTTTDTRPQSGPDRR